MGQVECRAARARNSDDMVSSPGGRLEQIRSAIDEYQGRLIGFAARITGDLESARDVVQDTFLRLCAQDLDEIGAHLPAWLFKVCRNRALDVRRKEAPLEPLDTSNGPTHGVSVDPYQLLEQSDQARLALAAIADLPAAQQEVLRLRFQEELSYKEISAITRHSVGSVGFLIHTGIQGVRRRLRVDSAVAVSRLEGGRTDA
jgi:RNA polymerase sigma factor (sigma-70 family)